MLDQTLDLAPLRRSLHGSLLTPADDAYERARHVFNAAVDRRPAAIVRVADVHDVQVALAAAREHELPLAIRGGRHSFAGDATVDGGLVLDLGALGAVGIDAERREGWAEGGATAGAYTTAAAEHGLATGFGDTGTVGIAGLTLGGGIDWLVRRHGLTIDSLLGAQVVTAGGEVIETDAERHPELFWALRGGGGNFGVVTRLRFRLHEVGLVYGGLVALPASAAVLAGLVTHAQEAPDDLTMIVHAGKAPPAPFLPTELHGRPVVFAMFVHAGEQAEGERTLAAIRGLADPLAELVRPMPYPEIFEVGGGPERAPFAVRNGFADAFDETAAEVALERIATAPSPMAMTQIRVLGGAVPRVPADATAFAHRDRKMLVITAAVGEDAAVTEAWVDGTAGALGLLASGAYVNYLSDDGDATVRRCFPQATLDRLRAVKRTYDPDNVFRVNRNVMP